MRRAFGWLLTAALLLTPCATLTADEYADTLRKRAQELEAEMAKLHAHITELAKEAARLRLEAARLEEGENAPKKAAPKKAAEEAPTATGLWGPLRKARPNAELVRNFQKGAAKTTSKQAAALVRTQALADLRPAHRRLLTDFPKKPDVLVVKGSFDKIERALTHLRIRYAATTPWDLASHAALSFKPYKVILWNCGEALSKRARKRIDAALRRFVDRGGYLYTTDWAILTILTPNFPGQFETSGKTQQIPEMVLQVTPATGASGSVYMRGVSNVAVKTRWWLEQAAFDIKPGAKFRGLRLLEAASLEKLYGRSSLVSAVFASGRGRVLHTMAHVYQEAGNLAGAMAAQRLLVNFILLARLDPKLRPIDGLPAPR